MKKKKKKQSLKSSSPLVLDGEIKQRGERGLVGVGGAAAEHVDERRDGDGEMTAVALRGLGEAADFLSRIQSGAEVGGLEEEERLIDGGGGRRGARSSCVIDVGSGVGEVEVAAAIFDAHIHSLSLSLYSILRERKEFGAVVVMREKI